MREHQIIVLRDVCVGGITFYEGDKLFVRIHPLPLYGDIVQIGETIQEYLGQDENLVKGIVYRIIRDIVPEPIHIAHSPMHRLDGRHVY